ncbi:hypothetical protein KEM52_000029 [Ascosphaera acerosa]|nr:hypothetical protein KEM52_000029 [Ascosphaera acerosa]
MGAGASGGAGNDVDKDEEDYLRVMRSLNQPTEDDLGLGDIWSRELETGEKADDAVDYEDIDDDDLPDEEETTGAATRVGQAQGQRPEGSPEQGVGLGLGLDLESGMPDVVAGDAIAGDESDADSLFGGDADAENGVGVEVEVEVEVGGETGAAEAAAESMFDDTFGDGEKDKVATIKQEAPSTLTLLPEIDTAREAGSADAAAAGGPVDEQDLFGDAMSTDATRDPDAQESPRADAVDERDDMHQSPAHPSDTPASQGDEVPDDMDPVTYKEWQLQQALFAMSSYGVGEPPAPPENHEQLLASLWPKFRRDQQPRFLELLPPKKSYYVGLQPPQSTRRLVPTKLHLDIAQDQERMFRTGVGAAKGKDSIALAAQSLVTVEPRDHAQGNTGDDAGVLADYGEDGDDDLPGGLTMHDLQIICDDWSQAVQLATPPDSDQAELAIGLKEGAMIIDESDDWQVDEPPAKRQRVDGGTLGVGSARHLDIPYFDDPLEVTEKLARTIQIDLNDPYLLLDEFADEAALRTAKRERHRIANVAGPDSGIVAKKIMNRYNISNDEAYDMLKENHQYRVRSILGNVAIEHSMPAIRLQWPYYKTRLARQEARSFHRPALSFFPNLPVAFRKPAFTKRKHQRGKDVKTLYDSTKALSLADNSHVMLVEYSEEYPLMLSNFGMGSRLVNYYRRKNMEDTSRPRAEIGETVVLLPQDKSPFSIFGHVDPGETTTAVVTSMFRVPVWHHQTKPTDFLVIRNSTGVEGTHYYLRIIENLLVAGQQFPSVDIPGPHSRKITTASKSRLKMIAYRKLRRSESHRVSVADITEHFPTTNDMQNRQKMKEFLQFNKDYKEWEMKPNETIPEEDALRGLVKPEDVCLLEGMQVGQQHLHDVGYDKDDDSGDEEDAKEGESLEQQLAPWKTTRNFLLASQGKAMLHLHGGGDPTGRGEGFSFIKTSMKGGFRALGESVEDKLDAARLKELGGHSYNVARQQKSYEESIRRIWEAQKKSLSWQGDESGDEFDLEDHETELERDRREMSVDTFRVARSERPTPSVGLGRRDDETASLFSRMSTSSSAPKIMKISRKIRNAQGEIETVVELVRDPRVIKQYQKQRHEAELRNLALNDIRPTGDPEIDARRMRHIQEELQRLQRNRERRHAREKQRGIGGGSMDLGSPGSASSVFGALAAAGISTPKGAGTTRKCANCGMTGHIKTNKKLCPMLNGTLQKQQNAMQHLSEGQSQGASRSRVQSPVPSAIAEADTRSTVDDHNREGSFTTSPVSAHHPI